MKKSPVCEKENIDETVITSEYGIAPENNSVLLTNKDSTETPKKRKWPFFVFIPLGLALIAGILLFILIPKLKIVNLTMDSFKDMTEREVKSLFGAPSREDSEKMNWGAQMFGTHEDGTVWMSLDSHENTSNLQIKFYEYLIEEIQYDKTNHEIKMFSCEKDFYLIYYLIDRYGDLIDYDEFSTLRIYTYDYKGMIIICTLTVDSDNNYSENSYLLPFRFIFNH